MTSFPRAQECPSVVENVQVIGKCLFSALLSNAKLFAKVIL